MIISYKDRKLQKLCDNDRVANQKLGKRTAERLRERLLDIEAVENVEALKAGNPHQLEGNRKGQYSLRLNGKRLVFEPDQNPVPCKNDGGIDWESVKAIKIIEIINYHD